MGDKTDRENTALNLELKKRTMKCLVWCVALCADVQQKYRPTAEQLYIKKIGSFLKCGYGEEWKISWTDEVAKEQVLIFDIDGLVMF